MYPRRLLAVVIWLVLAVLVIGQRHNLTICLLLEDDSHYTTHDKAAPAVAIAVEQANSLILPKDIRLNYVYRSLGASCSGVQHAALVNVISLQKDGISCAAFVGLSCPTSVSAVYGYAEINDIPIFGCPAAGIASLALNYTMSNYPMALRIAFGFRHLANFITAFLKLKTYGHVTLLRDEASSFHVLLSKFLYDHLEEADEEFAKFGVVRPFDSTMKKTLDYRNLLQLTNKDSRVIFILAHAEILRDIMVVAAKEGLTDGNRLFIAVELYDLAYWGSIKVISGHGGHDEKVAAEAFQHLVVISFQDTSATGETVMLDTLSDKIKRKARIDYGYNYKPLEPIDPVVIGHYESVMMFATVVNELYTAKQDFRNGSHIIGGIAGRTFTDIIDVPIRMGRDDLERFKDFEVKRFEPLRNRFEAFLRTFNLDTANQTFKWLNSTPFWPSLDGDFPPDEPTCGFSNEKCRDTSLPPGLLAAAVIIPLLIVTAALAAGITLFIRMKKLSGTFDPNWWRIPVEEVNVKKNRFGTDCSRKTLQSSTTGGNSEATQYSGYMCDILAAYKGALVSLVDVSSAKLIPHGDLINRINLMKTIGHPNLERFIGFGLTTDGRIEFIINELCAKGSLTDVLGNEMLKLDWSFKNSLINDIVMGMAHLHSTAIGSHGNLTSHTCLIDARFTVKISDYGMAFLRNPSDFLPPKSSDPQERNYELLLWRAPELLRQVSPREGTPRGDVYSFAIILQQIILRSGPYELPDDPLDLSHKEILTEIINANIPPVRPKVPRSSCSNELYNLMEQCWEEFPLERPTFEKIKGRLRKVIGDVGDNIVDLLFKRMEQYAADLEQKVAEKTQQFMDEKRRSEQLLSQLLPQPVADALTRGEHVDPETYECVTIFFSDIVGFTTICAMGTPMDAIALLNGLYTFFDSILERYDVYKVETIGDAYLVCSGLPVRNGNKHITEIAQMALIILNGISGFSVPNRPLEKLQLRIGINSGACAAGIVGLKMPRYCLFGDTVNVASRMESTGEPMKIQISESSKTLLESAGGFLIVERGAVQIKGKGILHTFWLLGSTR